MKKYIFIILVLCLCLVWHLNAQNCENRQQFTLCSGQSQTLEVASYLPGSTFIWSEGVTPIAGQTTNQMIVKETTSKQITKEYRCEVKFNGSKVETDYYTVIINPFTPVKLLADHLCEGELATFRLTSQDNYKEIMWTINGNYLSQNDTTSYLCLTKPLNIHLSLVNQYGCVSVKDSTFNVNLNPGGRIEKTRLITDKYFMNNVDCGNTIAEYSISGLEGNAKVTKWNILYGNTIITEIASGQTGKVIPTDKRFLEWTEIKNASTIRIKWAKTNQTYNIMLRATTSNGGCSFESDLSTILIKDYSPDADTLIQKPSSNTVLIFPSGQNRQDLNYQWGYTTSGKVEKLITGNNKFYIEITDPYVFNPSNEYWVETWYSSNNYCRNRTYLGK